MNLGCLSEAPPQSFQDVYDADKYQASQAYLKTHTRFSWIESLVHLSAVLIFWFCHGFEWLDQWIRGFGLLSTGSGILYIAFLSALRSMISLPFSLYVTFVIEERFGFNKTTWQTFILDRLKGLILGILLGVPLLWGVLVFFETAGNDACNLSGPAGSCPCSTSFSRWNPVSSSQPSFLTPIRFDFPSRMSM